MMNEPTDLFFCGDDLLQQGVYAKNIKLIIEKCGSFPRNNDNKSYVIGVDAPWGSGKTHFARMLKSYLEGQWEKPGLDNESREAGSRNTGTTTPICSGNPFSVVYYDAWKNDFWSNAFEPLFDCLIQSAPIISQVEKHDIVDLGKSAAKIIALGIKGVLSKRFEDYFDSSAYDDIASEIKTYWGNASRTDYQTGKIFPDYDIFRNAIEDLRDYLSSSVQHANKLVIIIDELDRCKPVFAVQTLEIVKHLFNIEGIVFVFSLDLRQLAHCVKVVYGHGFDAVGYLERFFNYLTILPHGKISSLATSLFTEFGIAGVSNDLIQRLVAIVEMQHLSLREVKTVLSTFAVLQNTVLSQYTNYSNAVVLYFYFICMKYKQPLLFSNGVFEDKTQPVVEYMTQNPIPFDYGDSRFSLDIISLICSNRTIGESEFSIIINGKCADQRLKKIRRIINTTLIFQNGDEEVLSPALSLSLFLYMPDLIKFNEIKKFTMLEYIYRQIEMCDFIG